MLGSTCYARCAACAAAAGKAGTPLPAKYDLVANIVHEGKAGEGVYKVHVHRKVEDIWYEVQVRGGLRAGGRGAQREGASCFLGGAGCARGCTGGGRDPCALR